MAYQNKIKSEIGKLAREALIALYDSEQTEKAQVYLQLTKQLQQQHNTSLLNLSLNLSSFSAGAPHHNELTHRRESDSSLMSQQSRSHGLICDMIMDEHHVMPSA